MNSTTFDYFDYLAVTAADTDNHGPHVRAIANKLLHMPRDSVYFDHEKAQNACKFFPKFLRLKNKPFNLIDWEAFIVQSAHGWHRVTGQKLISSVYMETGKGSGKSPLAAGMLLYQAKRTDLVNAEIYSAANTRDQAALVFRTAVNMIESSPALLERFRLIGRTPNVWGIHNRRTGTDWKVLSSDSTKKSGYLPVAFSYDELHESPDGNLLDALLSGHKSAHDPLSIILTNPGSAQAGICWELRQRFIEALDKPGKHNELPFICDVDPADDERRTHPSQWIKTNPSMPLLPGTQYLETRLASAEGLPARMANVSRLNFGRWSTLGKSPLLALSRWAETKTQRVTLDTLRGKTCVLAIDLSKRLDLIGYTLATEVNGVALTYSSACYPALDERRLAEKSREDHAHYIEWARSGQAHAIAGESLNYDSVCALLANECKGITLEKIVCDPWRVDDFRAALGVTDYGAAKPGAIISQFVFAQGIKIETHGQTAKDFSRAVEQFEERLLTGKLQTNKSGVLDYCVNNISVWQDANGNRKFLKTKERLRIDCAISLAMALNKICRADAKPFASVYAKGAI